MSRPTCVSGVSDEFPVVFPSREIKGEDGAGDGDCVGHVRRVNKTPRRYPELSVVDRGVPGVFPPDERNQKGDAPLTPLLEAIDCGVGGCISGACFLRDGNASLNAFASAAAARADAAAASAAAEAASVSASAACASASAVRKVTASLRNTEARTAM